MDFTLNKYKHLLQTIYSNAIPVYPVREWIENPQNHGIIIRHDVDRFSFNALKMAEIENMFNISTTYYFRMTKSSFNPAVIKKIADLGHEIGYHYEDLSWTRGDKTKALKLFQVHLKRLRKLASIDTIAMHGNPLSRYDNRDLWKEDDWQHFGISGEAFLSVDYSDIYYFTDTGRSWRDDSVNIRDNVNSFYKKHIENTDQLIALIIEKESKIALTIHPERWAYNWPVFLRSYVVDLLFNNGKRIIKILR